LVQQVKAAMGLSADQSYHVYIAGLSQKTSMEAPLRASVCTPRWRTPADLDAPADDGVI
jgi:hypothetical protein